MLRYLLAMTIFGTIGLFVRFIELPSTVIALSRGIIGTLFLLCVVFLSGQKLRTAVIKQNAVRLLAAGIMLGLNWIFLFEAYRFTSVASATLAYYMAPVILIILSPIVLKERVSAVKWLCVLVALIGMVLTSGLLDANQSTGWHGILMGLVAACFYAGVVLNNKFLRDLTPYESTVSQLLISGLVLLPYVLATVELDPAQIPSQTIWLTLTVGIVHTGIAYWLYFSALPRLEAARIAIFSYIDPAVAILLSVFVLMEPMSASGIAGAFLILGAALASELSAMKRPHA